MTALLTPKEAAQRLGLSVRTLQRLDKTGEFPAVHLSPGRRAYTLHAVAQRLGLTVEQLEAGAR